MVLVAKIGTGRDRRRGEWFALCSWRLEGRDGGWSWPGLGLLGMLNYHAARVRLPVLQLALRRWNVYGMKIQIGSCQGLLAFFWFGLATSAPAAPPTPLRTAHAHNDYEHARPLLDALDHGFCSVEADVHLVEGRLLVAHDRDQVKPERTLQKLYLDPLRERARQHGGRVFPGGPELTLLIDFKSDAEATYRVLREVLKEYADVLTVFRPDATTTNAVTVILSGNRPTAMVAAEAVRYAAIDGRLPDLETNPSPHLVPLVSDNWTKHFQWRGAGALPEPEREKLRQLTAQAHRQNRRVRLWATPDEPAAWRELQAAGVDLINTDKLTELREFLLKPSR